MSYVDLLNQYREKNSYEYANHAAIYEQVKAAMLKSGEERSEALRDVLKNNYMADAEKYEPMRKKLVQDLWSLSGKKYDEVMAKTGKMSGSAQFLEEYVAIIGAMAKDVDSSYEPEFMLGMTASDAKNYVSGHLNSFTIHDQLRHSLSKDDWQTRFENLNDATMEDGEYLNYETATTGGKGNMKETYMRKEMIKADLKSMNFFKRYFSQEGKMMRKYIKTAEEALKKAGFTKTAAREAEIESTRTAALENEYEGCYIYIDSKFTAHAEGREAEFEHEFRMRNINDDTTLENENVKESVQFKAGDIDNVSKTNEVGEKHADPIVKDGKSMNLV